MEYGQGTHANPDRDRDGYLAVSSLEKEFIGALRDSKLAQYGPSRPPSSARSPTNSIAQSNAEISGKFNLFQKMFNGAVPHLTTLQGSAVDDARTGLTPDERRLYDEAAGRLAAMTQKFVNRESGITSESKEE